MKNKKILDYADAPKKPNRLLKWALGLAVGGSAILAGHKVLPHIEGQIIASTMRSQSIDHGAFLDELCAKFPKAREYVALCSEYKQDKVTGKYKEDLDYDFARKINTEFFQNGTEFGSRYNQYSERSQAMKAYMAGDLSILMPETVEFFKAKGITPDLKPARLKMMEPTFQKFRGMQQNQGGLEH